jgi:uncharacterized membrane protein
MVDLLEADPTLSDREAALRAVTGLAGNSARHAERVRKKHHRLKQAGQLPKGGEVGLIERRSVGIRDLYHTFNTRTEETRQELAQAEKHAQALGVDLTEDLLALSRALENRKESLGYIVYGPVDIAVSAFRQRGVHDPEEAVAQYQQAIQELKRISELLEAVKKVRSLRFTLGLE